MELKGIKRKLQIRKWLGVCEFGYEAFRILGSAKQLLYHGTISHIVKTGRFTGIKIKAKTFLSIC